MHNKRKGQETITHPASSITQNISWTSHPVCGFYHISQDIYIIWNIFLLPHNKSSWNVHNIFIFYLIQMRAEAYFCFLKVKYFLYNLMNILKRLKDIIFNSINLTTLNTNENRFVTEHCNIYIFFVLILLLQLRVSSKSFK